jgi:hypothetical protein
MRHQQLLDQQLLNQQLRQSRSPYVRAHQRKELEAVQEAAQVDDLNRDCADQP